MDAAAIAGALFQEIRFGGLSCKNRFIRSATNDFLGNTNGSISQRELSIYEELARGGGGLIITANMYVSPEGKNDERMASLSGEYSPSGLKRLVDSIHSYGSALMAQISHAGIRSLKSPKIEREYASVGEIPPGECRRLVRCFGAAARRARDAGFDGVQLHCAHGYLLSEFLDPAFNDRTDEYGGDAGNRLRLAIGCVDEIRKTCGSDFPVSVKINCNTAAAGKNDAYLAELGKMLSELEKAGVSFAEISGYDFRSFKRADKNYYLRQAKTVRRATSLPLAIAGGTRTLGDMAAALAAGMDMISMSRPFICEPDLIGKLESGRSDGSRCVTCNGCFTLPRTEGRRCALHLKTSNEEDGI